MVFRIARISLHTHSGSHSLLLNISIGADVLVFSTLLKFHVLSLVL